MKKFWEGFCEASGNLVGVFATLVVIGWAAEMGEKKSKKKDEE